MGRFGCMMGRFGQRNGPFLTIFLEIKIFGAVLAMGCFGIDPLNACDLSIRSRSSGDWRSSVGAEVEYVSIVF